MTSGQQRLSRRLTFSSRVRLDGWKCRGVCGEVKPEISPCSPAVSATDNPVWIPASRAACWDDYHNEGARWES